MTDDPLIGWQNDSLRFDQMLGRGGMGAVYKGIQVRMDRQVAIKVIKKELAVDPTYIERFEREAKTLGRLVHPHVIACHDFGPCPGPDGGQLYVMVLEFVDGWSLASLQKQKKVTVRSVLELHRQACEGLQAAHALSIVHRDIKPDNIMVTKQGQAKLADFGLARADDSVQLTQTGAIMGSPAYMAPEACRGDEPGQPADIYSMGCSLFQSLTGVTPFTGSSSLHMIHQHVSAKAPLLSSLRPDLASLDEIVATCLAKDPHERFPSPATLGKALAVAIQGLDPALVAGSAGLPGVGSGPTEISGARSHAPTPTQATMTTPPTRPRSDRQPAVRSDRQKAAAAGRPGWIVPAAVVGGLAVAGALVAAFAGGDAPPAPAPAPVVPVAEKPIAPAAPAEDPHLREVFERMMLALADGRIDEADGLLAKLPKELPPLLAKRREDLIQRIAARRQELAASAKSAKAGEEQAHARIRTFIAEGALDQAEGALAALPADGDPAERQRLREQLDEVWTQRRKGTAALLDRGEAMIATGDAKGAANHLAGVQVAARFTDLQRRRDDLLAQARSAERMTTADRPAADQPQQPAANDRFLQPVPPGVHVLRQIQGDPLAPGDPRAPFGTPRVHDGVRLSLPEGETHALRIDLQRMRIPANTALHLYLHPRALGSKGPRTLRLAGDDGKTLAEIPDDSPAWRLVTVRLPEGGILPQQLTIVGDGREPFALARAAIANGRTPALLELGLVPGGLRPFPMGSENPSMRTAVANLRKLRPDAVRSDRMHLLFPESLRNRAKGSEQWVLGMLNQGLQGGMGGPPPPPQPGQRERLTAYSRLDDALIPRIAKEAEPDLLFIAIDTQDKPTINVQQGIGALGKAYSDRARPMIPVVILGTEGYGTPAWDAWQAWLDAVAAKLKILPVIDLGQVPALLTQLNPNANPRDEQAIRLTGESLAASVQDLRTRLDQLAGPIAPAQDPGKDQGAGQQDGGGDQGDEERRRRRLPPPPPPRR